MKEFLLALFGLWLTSPFNISGESMEPFLSHEDTAMFESYTYMFEEPQRGDVIVFLGTDEPDKYFVKRIIGLPEEEILIREGKIYVVEDNGTENEIYEPYLPEYKTFDSLRDIDGKIYSVPKDKYFVLGDNRDSSYDSRTWTDPYIPKKSIVGKYYYTLF